MRRFTFRGQDINTGQWIYGHLHISYKDSYIGEEDAYYISSTEVKLSTIGQYVGLKDVNGKDIYEGDLLYIDEELPCVLVKWSYSDHGFAIFWTVMIFTMFAASLYTVLIDVQCRSLGTFMIKIFKTRLKT